MEYIIDCNKDSVLTSVLTDRYNPHATLIKEVMKWLDENCHGWTYHGVVSLPGDYNEGLRFTFIDESDIVAFKLRWS